MNNCIKTYTFQRFCKKSKQYAFAFTLRDGLIPVPFASLWTFSFDIQTRPRYTNIQPDMQYRGIIILKDVLGIVHLVYFGAILNILPMNHLE